jgi:predicted nicotinamide N-methyase
LPEGYAVIEQTIDVAGRTWRIRTLKDRQQFHDPAGKFEASGISPATWPLFGVIWQAGIMLADYMADYPVAGLRILEIGCGLGLPSMVIHARGGKVTASDIHPLAGEFLADNLERNGLPPLPFRILDWREDHGSEPYDLIIGSDLLYERDQPELLAAFIDRHCRDSGEVILTDPGRGQMGKFNRLMADNGFSIAAISRGKAGLASYARSTLSHHEESSTT